MSRIGTNVRWKKTAKGWRYIYNDDDRKVINRCLEQSLQVAPLNIKPEVWQCVLAYITSPTDLQNLAATCQFLYELVENKLGWSYLIRTKFGHRLWLHHVRQIFNRQRNQQINLHADIETMGKIELLNECAIIPATFLLNRTGDQIMVVKRAILRSYRYYLEIQVSKRTVYMVPSEFIFRQFVSFKNIHSEHLTDTQRRTVPLTKLIYFYLTDQRHVPVVNFSMIYTRE
jgi:hypothetical protein